MARESTHRYWPDPAAVRWQFPDRDADSHWVLHAHLPHHTKRDGKEWHVSVDFGISRAGLWIGGVHIRPALQLPDERGVYPSVTTDALRVPLGQLLRLAEEELRKRPEQLQGLRDRFEAQGDDDAVEMVTRRLGVAVARSQEADAATGSRRGYGLSDQDDRATAVLFPKIYGEIDDEGRPPHKGEVLGRMEKELGIGRSAVRARLRRATKAGWLTTPSPGSQQRDPGPRWTTEESE